MFSKNNKMLSKASKIIIKDIHQPCPQDLSLISELGLAVCHNDFADMQTDLELAALAKTAAAGVSPCGKKGSARKSTKHKNQNVKPYKSHLC